jgi:hypothetical protein
MSQRASNDSVTTARAALRMDQVPTALSRLATPACYAATTMRDSADANASESTRPS